MSPEEKHIAELLLDALKLCTIELRVWADPDTLSDNNTTKKVYDYAMQVIAKAEGDK